MGNDLNTSLNINVGGNFRRQLTANEHALRHFSKQGQKQLHLMRRSSLALAKGLDRMGNRYTGLLTGAVAVGTGKMLISLERRFTRLGIEAEKSAEYMNGLKKEIYDVANAPDIRVGPSEITAAIESIVTKTGDLEFARANIENIGYAIQATGSKGGAIGDIMAEFQKMGIVLKKDVLIALDILNVQGKEGAFTLENLAALGPRVVTAYTSMGRGGVQAIKEMGAALQVIRMGTGSSEQAATSFEAVLRTLSDNKKVAMLQKGGLQIFDVDALKEGREVLRPINELIVEIVKKTEGKKTILSQVFDAEAMRAFNAVSAEFQRTGSITSMDRFMTVHADGTTTLKNSARAAKDAAGSVQLLSTAWQKFADESLTGPIQDLSKLIDKLGSENTGKVLKGLAIGAGALVAGSLAAKAVRGGKSVARFLGKGKAGALGGALGAAGATPVFVVNMPGVGAAAGLAGAGVGAGGIAGGAAGAAGVAKLSRLQSLRAMSTLRGVGRLGIGAVGTAGALVAGAGVAGYGAGRLIDYAFLNEQIRDTIGGTITQILANFGSDSAQQNLDRMMALKVYEGTQSSLKIEVSDTRIKVKSIDGNGMDIRVDTGLVMP